MRQIAPFKKYVLLEYVALAMCSQDQETTIFLKMIPRSLNMNLRSCPRITYALDISVQAMRFSLSFFADHIY